MNSKIIHEMKLQSEPFESIKTGQKIIESRLFDDKRKLIKIGDTIQFKNNSNPTDTISTEVIALLNYPNFDSLFSDFPANWFGLPNKQELLDQIEQFYSLEEQQKYGVLGIKIKLI